MYDPAAGSWIQPLVDALLDGEEPNAIPTGDVNCDGVVDIIDALMIAQFVAGTRNDRDSCPLGNAALELNASMGDVDRNLILDIIDALLLARCVAQVSEIACPAG